MVFKSTDPSSIRIPALEEIDRISRSVKQQSAGMDFKLDDSCDYGSGMTDTAVRELFEFLQQQTQELKRQADSQEQICDGLEIESKNRSRDDKRYFWRGVVCSAVIAFSVQYLPALIKFLRSLLPR